MAKQVALPSPLVSLHPNTPRINVGPGGVIDPNDAPARFLVGQRERGTVVWVVTNTSGKPITVTLTDFMLKNGMFDKKGTVPVPCMQWLTGSAAVQVDDGKTALLGAMIHPDYKLKGIFDHVSYTIQVRSQAGAFDDVDYDPDGDIKP
jgi:hypothetical protein